MLETISVKKATLQREPHVPHVLFEEKASQKRGIIKEQVSEKEIKEQSVSGNKVTRDH